MKTDFATRLRKLRKQKGLNIREMSEKTKIPYFTLISLELKRSKVPALPTVIVLAKFFKLSIDELLKGVKFED